MELTFDVQPGKIYQGKIREQGYGVQVSVIVYTGDNRMMNFFGRIYIRVVAVMSYAY